MDAEGHSDTAAIVASLLKRFVKDREHGDLAPLATYQAAFSGFEDLVAEHYGRVEAGTDSPPSDEPAGHCSRSPSCGCRCRAAPSR